MQKHMGNLCSTSTSPKIFRCGISGIVGGIWSSARWPVYWLDVGNRRSIGQIAWGNTGDVKRLEGEIGQPAYIERVPYPPMAYPGIIDLSKDEEVLDDAGSCAEAMVANVQGLNINLMMATLASEMVRRFFEGNLSIHAVEVDLDSFATVSQPLTDSWLRLVVEKHQQNND